MAQPPIQIQGRSDRGFSPATESEISAPPAGGKIKGPGTGTSDSIPDRMRPGTFIMPADSVKVLGVDTLNKMANTPARQGNFTPEQAHAAGIAFLTQLRDATHRPVTDTTDGDADTEGPDDIDPEDTTDGDMDTEGPMDADIADDGSSRNFARGGMVDRNSAPGNQSWMIQHQGAGEGTKKLMSGNGGYANGGPVLGGYRYSELPTEDEINTAVGAKEQSEREKLTQLQASPVDPFSGAGQGRAADITATQNKLANLQSARAVGKQQLQFGPGAGKMSGDSQGNAGAFALTGALQEAKGMRVTGRPVDARSIGPAQAPMQLNSNGTVQNANNQYAKGFEPGRFANGGAVGCGGGKLKARGFAGGGEVDNPFNFYPQNSPDAGAGIYDGLGTELGSSGKLAQVPAGVIGQQPPKPTAPPPVATRGSPAGSAAAKDVQAPGVSYTDNNQAAGQGIKDSWNKGNYGEAVGKTVAGTVGMFTTPLIDGAVHGGGAAWDGAKGFGRGIFGMNDAASASAAPKPKAESAPPPAPASNNYKAAADAESQAWSDQVATTDSLKQRLAEKGRDGMTNAEVGQANPNGVVTMKRQANGVMEFSGNNIKGPVSYADDQGQAIAGAGMRSKGFGRVDVAPAGANVVMGPNGSYAFSNDPAPSGGQQASQPRGDRGFPGAQQKPDNSSWMQPGMTAEQSLQYNQEVANARAINAQQQALRPARPEGTIMDGLMERTPDQQLRDAKVQASSLHGGTAAYGKGRLAEIVAANTARAKFASDKYASDNQLAGTSLTAGAQTGAASIHEQGATARAADTNAIAQGELAMKQETHSFQNRLAAQQEQLRNDYQNATDPKQQAAIAERLRVLTGKDKPEAWKAVALSGGKDEFGNTQPGGALIYNPATGGYQHVQGGMGQLPPGMKKQVGTSNGKPVYEDAQGKRFVAS